MQSDFAKYDGIKYDSRIRWTKSSDFGPKSDDSTQRMIKSKKGIGLQSSKNLIEHSRPGTAAVQKVYTANTITMRERSRRASPQPDYS